MMLPSPGAVKFVILACNLKNGDLSMRAYDCCHRPILLAVLVLLTSACGMRGPLYLPQDQARSEPQAERNEPAKALP